jgi:putative membrane protein
MCYGSSVELPRFERDGSVDNQEKSAGKRKPQCVRDTGIGDRQGNNRALTRARARPSKKPETCGRSPVIRSYSDHAANERTFLAWVRTGIAVVVFGFVIERFNLFLLTMASVDALDARSRRTLEKLSGPAGRYEGFVLILVGLALIVAAAIRFIRIRRLLAAEQVHEAGGYGPELLLSAVLVLVVAAFSINLSFG